MKALITGITGQDGSYLAEFLLAKGYQVHGIIRRSSSFNTQRIDHLYRDPHDPEARLFLHYGDLTDGTGLREVLTRVQPDEIYNLGAQSHVRVSFDQPVYTVQVDALGTIRLLEALRDTRLPAHFYQASSSEMYGQVLETPQRETTPFYPRSPYACAKVFSFWQTINYRESYGLFASNGILFNHESPRRGETFVTRKITRGIATILSGQQKCLYLGNLDARRDWGFAPEYVEAMWLMLQQDRSGDYCVGTGESHTVREFLETAFGYVGVKLEWKGQGVEEQGVVAGVAGAPAAALSPGQTVVQIDPRYFRPCEVELLQADASKARRELGWSPRTSFRELVMIMCDYDLKMAGLVPPGQGISVCREKGFGYTHHDFTLNGVSR